MSLIFGLSMLALFSISDPVPAQRGAADCVIRVDEPTDDQKAGRDVEVKGFAKLPPGYRLWVFVRPEDHRATDEWWPQYTGESRPDGTWRVRATLGGANNVGDEFDVAVAVFKEKQHNVLASHLQMARDTGKFKAIKMPSAACPPVFRVVVKTSHPDPCKESVQ